MISRATYLTLIVCLMSGFTLPAEAQSNQELARDGFESGNFSGGTGSWVGGWSTSGDVSLQTGAVGSQSGGSHLRIRDVGTSVLRRLDLSGASQVRLSYWGRARDFEQPDALNVRVSIDGGPFATVDTLTTADSDDTYHFHEVDLSGFAPTSDVRIQFDSDVDEGRFFLDDVVVEGSLGPDLNQAPIAVAGQDRSVSDRGGDFAELVTLDGSASFDPDGVIVSYEWRERGVLLGVGVTPSISVGIGTHDLDLTVADAAGASATDSVTITVEPGRRSSAFTEARTIAPPTEGVLEVTPNESFSSSGLVGGPFSPQEKTYTLRNSGETELDFGVTFSRSWLEVVGPDTGSLSPGESRDVTISLHSAEAGALPLGEYFARISFSNTTSGSGDSDRGAALTISDPAQGELHLTPSTDLNAVGVAGGPFAPSSRAYTLENTGGATTSWSVLLSEPWIRVIGANSGQLSTGASTVVTVELDDSLVNTFAPGSYPATVEFLDTGLNASVGQRNVSLFVTQVEVGGWTEFTPSADTRIVYVSSSTGSDANDGLSQANPKASISAGLQLMRHGFPDWLLLKKGDTFTGADIPVPGYRWQTSGRSAGEPTLLSSYGPSGDPRPLISTAGKGGLRIVGGGGTPSLIAHVAFVGLDLDASPRNALTEDTSGFNLNHNMQDILIEDCRIANFGDGIIAQLTGGRLTDVRIRRSVIHHNYDGNGSHAQGIYCDEVTNLLIEENVIDHNGWSSTDPDATPPDIFKHSIYIQADAESVTVRGNIISNGSSHGLQLRPGGVCENNLFVRNAIALLIAGDGVVRDNVILDGKDITPTRERRQGIHIQNIPSAAQVTNNLIVNSQPGSGSRGFTIQPLEFGGQWFGVNNLELDHNLVYAWGGRVLEIKEFVSNTAVYSAVNIHDNDFQNSVNTVELLSHNGSSTVGPTSMSNNSWFSFTQPIDRWTRIASNYSTLGDYLELVGDSTSSASEVPYPDPGRSVETYNQSLGRPASYEDFIDQALLQSRDFWRPEYTAAAVNAYIRQGFGR